MSRFAALALAVALLVAVGAGCSDGDGDGAADDRADGAATTAASDAPLPGPPADPAVVGTWTADGEGQLAEVLSEQGLEEVPECTGTVALELREDGGFTRTLSGTCAFAEGDGEVELVTSGGYATQGGDLVLTHVSGSGAIRGADGEELALPDEQAAAGGAAAYEVTPEELVLTLPEAAGSVTFTRT